MDELEAPDESFEALRLTLEHAFETGDECIERIATPVVVAELRRLADLWTDDWMVQSWLRKRAAALEAGQ